MQIKILKKTRIYHIVFLTLLIYLSVLFGKIFLQFDDYGYVSLSYGFTIEGVTGSKYNLYQLFQFMGEHYIHANGRIIYLFIEPFIYMIGGLRLLQFSAALSITVVLYLVFYILRKILSLNETETDYLAVFLVASFGLIGMGYYKDGLAWYSAEFLYVLPAIPFLIYAVWLYHGEKDQWIIGVVAAFFAAWSEEQWYCALVVLTVSYYIGKMITREKISRDHIFPCIIACLGGIPDLISPGIHERLHSPQNAVYLSLSFFPRLMKQIFPVRNKFCYGDRSYMLLFRTAILVFAFLIFIKSKERSLKIIRFIFFALSVAFWLSGIGFCFSHTYFNICFDVFFSALVSVELIVFFVRENLRMIAAVTVAAYVSVACMLFVPEHAGRLMIPFVLLSYIILGSIFIYVFREWKRFYIIAALSLAIFASLVNVTHIYQGYSSNYQTHLNNDRYLKELSVRILL